MADVRGMRELGQSLTGFGQAENTLANTYGDLPYYAPGGLKQTALAAGTARAANDLSTQNDLAWDQQAERQWQQEAAGRDDFGTAEYANDKVKFLQSVGASPTAITRNQLQAQQATHTGQMQDLAQNYVQTSVEDKIAQKLGLEYYSDNLKALQAQLVKDGASPQEAADKLAKAAIQAGRSYMEDKGIVANINHTTGAIMVQDKEGNNIALPPDIAAEAYKMLGHPVPWATMRDIQNESLLTGKTLGTTAYAGAAAPVAAAPGLSPAQAMTLSKNAEALYRSVQLEQIKEANKAATAVVTAGGTQDEADAAHDKVMKRLQPIVDQHKQEVERLHAIMARTGVVQAQAAAPLPLPAPQQKYDPELAAAQAQGQAAANPQNAHPANVGANALANQQSLQARAMQIASLVKNLHLDQGGLNSPEVQAYLATLDPQSQAVVRELLQHAAQAYMPSGESMQREGYIGMPQ